MNFKRPSHTKSYIEIAPLVDVVFLLLLFFVLSYNATGENAIDVLLPTSTQADRTVRDIIVLAVHADGRLFLNGERYSLPETIAELRNLRNRGEPQIVTIRADRRLAVKALVETIDAIKVAGFNAFSIVTATLE